MTLQQNNKKKRINAKYIRICIKKDCELVFANAISTKKQQQPLIDKN